MTVRPAPRALTVMRDYDSGMPVSQWPSGRPRTAGSSLSARCKRLEENVLENLSTLQRGRRDMEAVVQRRKEKAQEAAAELQDALKQLRKGNSSSGENSMLGISPLNFTTMKERTAAIEETVYRNQGTLDHCRGILDTVAAAKKEKEEMASARTALLDEEMADTIRVDDAESPDSRPADRLDMIEANANMLKERLQARADSSLEEDVTQLQVDQYEADVKARAEARQYILFGISPSLRMATASGGRPSSAPAGSRGEPMRPSSAFERRPPSAASTPAGRSSAARPTSAGRPRSGTGGLPSRPCSANSMRARMKVMEDNLARNGKTLVTNRDGIEFVKARREQARQAMAQLIVELEEAKKK